MHCPSIKEIFAPVGKISSDLKGNEPIKLAPLRIYSKLSCCEAGANGRQASQGWMDAVIRTFCSRAAKLEMEKF